MTEPREAPTVLLVDDEPEIQRTLKTMLEYRGYRVLTAGAAEEAMLIIDGVEGTELDVIVSDIVLPNSSGLDVLAHARMRRPDVEVVLMSGAPTLETASAAVRLGAYDYLFKPISGFELADVIRSALERRSRRVEDRVTAESQAAHIEVLSRAVETRSRELRESASRYRHLVDQLEVVVFEIDLPTRRLTHIGGGLARRISGGMEPSTDCDFMEFVDEPDRSLVESLLEGLAKPSTEGLHPFELRFVPKEGGLVWVRCIPSPRVANQLSRLTGILVDITERKRAEEERAALELELSRAREELDRRLLRGLAIESDGAPVRIRSSDSPPDDGSQMIFGGSAQMAEVRRLAELAGEHQEPVLIMGETGTGKGALAEWIHHRSQFSKAAFVSINCATLRGELLLSELFGHARGAFTSAVAARRGLIEEASGGTLFLDEIGEMSLEVQGQLLKVLEEKTFRRLGESKLIRSEFRLICATNRDLRAAAEDGTFRRDLLYRIEVFPIAIAPLRERPEDIGELARSLAVAAGALGVKLPNETLRFLEAQPWPGNVRELRNALVRATLLSRGRELRPEYFEGFFSTVRPEARVGRDDARSVNERERILELLARFDGNRAKVARELGVARSSLYRKLKSYGID